MKTVTVYPPKMEAIGQALDIFGESRVVMGEWNEPVTIEGLTQSEASFAQQFFGEKGYSVEVQNKMVANAAVQELIASSQVSTCV